MARPPATPNEPPVQGGDRGRRRGGLSEARTYRPRGRTVRELPVRQGRGGDPFRPALQVLDGSSNTRRGGDRSRSKSAARTRVTAGTGRRRSGTGRRAPAVRRPRPPRMADPRRRLRLATVLALTLFTVLGVRLVELQITDGPAYAANALANRLREVELPAPRGAIYDRAGSVLAHSVETRFIYADPEAVEDPEQTAAALEPILEVPAAELVERMRPRRRADGSPSQFEWLARRVDVSVAEEIRALGLSGIHEGQDERRHVPGGDLAANVIGFTGEDLRGLAGLEASFDEALRGIDGKRTYESGLGRLARQIPGGYLVETPAQPGSDLRLTLDMDLQYEAQRVLTEALRGAEATFGAAVVLDSRTGEVLALASYPTYDAADPLRASEVEWADVATTRVVDPGSSHKPLVFGAALQEGVISPTSTVVVGPTIHKADIMFQDHAYPFPEGTAITLPAAMAFSSNVATIKIADQLGKEPLYRYQQAFGLGTPTQVGLPGEAAGALLAPADWSGSSYGSVPIGHSVDATPLQMAAAYAVIANDGVWVQPRLVQAVITPDGTEIPVESGPDRQVLSQENAAALREMMEAVVTVPYATGLDAAVENYRVAGKTGTGQLVVDGEYAPGYVSSFIGMAPADAPQYVVAVFAHLPGDGSAVVNPAFREMMDFTLKHYRLPPAVTKAPAFDLYPAAEG